MNLHISISFVFLLLFVVSSSFLISCSSQENIIDSSTTVTNSSFVQNSSSDSGIHDGTCPYGIHNDPAPGSCRFYVDADSDHICDHSLD